ncbi:hypothetical protein GN958_ATG17019 [Phytophthora infestans]|uniref:Uncharacterized protein n=1 Tax=Phytophthora infestans TaxID=4787 RepID=A0A8S9U1S2_PHYIN|nr:hypothetical protein GN958_ATG17019 [Phytophthora infestans]
MRKDESSMDSNSSSDAPDDDRDEDFIHISDSNEELQELLEEIGENNRLLDIFLRLFTINFNGVRRIEAKALSSTRRYKITFAGETSSQVKSVLPSTYSKIREAAAAAIEFGASSSTGEESGAETLSMGATADTRDDQLKRYVQDPQSRARCTETYSARIAMKSYREGV